MKYLRIIYLKLFELFDKTNESVVTSRVKWHQRLRELLRVSEANEVPISSHIYMDRLVDIQTVLKPFLKNIKKLK